MKKYVWVVAALVVTSVFVSTVYAPPHSVLGKLLGFWGKRSEKLLAIKRDLNNDAFVVVFNGKEVKAYKFPKKGPMQEMEPLLTYEDVEKLKTIKADAGWAHKKFMEWGEVQGKEPLIRAIMLNVDPDDGTLKFHIHIYNSTNDYRGAWAVDAKTWQFDEGKVAKRPNPMHEIWAVDKVPEGEASSDTEAKAEPKPAATEAAEGRAEGEGRRGGRRQER